MWSAECPGCSFTLYITPKWYRQPDLRLKVPSVKERNFPRENDYQHQPSQWNAKWPQVHPTVMVTKKLKVIATACQPQHTHTEAVSPLVSHCQQWEPTDTEGKLPMKDTDKRELKKRSEGAPKKQKQNFWVITLLRR